VHGSTSRRVAVVVDADCAVAVPKSSRIEQLSESVPTDCHDA
jgi:hypothetical protein